MNEASEREQWATFGLRFSTSDVSDVCPEGTEAERTHVQVDNDLPMPDLKIYYRGQSGDRYDAFKHGFSGGVLYCERSGFVGMPRGA